MNLNVNDAVATNDGYVIRLDRGKYVVDGVEVELKSSGIFTVSDVNRIHRVVKGRSYISHFENTETGEVISKEEYNDILKPFSHLWDGFAEEYFFPDQQTEIEFVVAKHKLDKFTSRSSFEEDTLRKVEANIIGSIEPTGSRFIVNNVSLGLRTAKSYSVLVAEIAMDEYIAWREKNPDQKVSLPSQHSNLKFLKIDNEYIFTGTSYPAIEGKVSTQLASSLENAKEIENELRKVVRTRLEATKKQLTRSNVAVLTSKAERILTSVSSLSVHAKCNHDKISLMNSIKEFLNEIEASGE